jgi:hypothetical protein
MRLLDHAVCINLPGFGAAAASYEASVIVYRNGFNTQHATDNNNNKKKKKKAKKCMSQYPPTPARVAMQADAERLKGIYQYLEDHVEIRNGLAAVVEFGAMLCRCIGTESAQPPGSGDFTLPGEKAEGTPAFWLPNTHEILQGPHMDGLDGSNSPLGHAAWSKTFRMDAPRSRSARTRSANGEVPATTVSSEPTTAPYIASPGWPNGYSGPECLYPSAGSILDALSKKSAEGMLSAFAMETWMADMNEWRSDMSDKRRKLREVTDETRSVVVQFMQQHVFRADETAIKCVAACAGVDMLLNIVNPPQPQHDGLEFLCGDYPSVAAMDDPRV